jgi:transposase
MSRQPGTGVPLAGLRRTNFYGNQPWLRNPAARCTRPPQIVAQRAPANSTVCAELPLAKSAPRKLLQQRFDFLPTPTTHRTHPLSSPHSITPSPDVVGRTNTLEQQPYSGHIFIFRGRRGDMVKLLWFDGDGLCLLQKRLERGRFVWPQASSGTVSLSRAQLSMLLEGIDWRAPLRTAERVMSV